MSKKKNLIYTMCTTELLETIEGDVRSDESNGMATKKELLQKVNKVQKWSVHVYLITVFSNLVDEIHLKG